MIGNMIKSNFISILFCILIGAAGLLGLLFTEILRWRKLDYGVTIFRSLGLFTITSIFWVFTDSSLAQLFFKNSQIIMVLSFEMFMLFPIPLLQFIAAVCSHNKNILKSFEIAFAFNFLIQNFFYIGSIFNFIQMIKVTHILDGLTMLYLIYYTIKEIIYYKSTYAKAILIGISSFACISTVSLITFYQSDGMENSRFFVLGLIVFLCILIFLSIKKYLEISEDLVRAKTYKEWAYKDALTGMGSRMLYEHQITHIPNRLKKDNCVSVILFDINDLKYVNDKFGHSEGDKLIKDAADCIQKTFGEKGNGYRIGGDEFVVIIWGDVIETKEYQEIFDQYINLCNQSRRIPISVAVGYATRSSTRNGEVTIANLVKEADEMMYEQKKQHHKEWKKEYHRK